LEVLVTIGVSIALLVVGAILKFAVMDNINNVDLSAVGVILMVAGALGLVISLFMLNQRRSAGGVVEERRVYDDRL
jgi:hypothetical protein